MLDAARQIAADGHLPRPPPPGPSPAPAAPAPPPGPLHPHPRTPEPLRQRPRNPRPHPRHQRLHARILSPQHPPARPAPVAPQRPGRAARDSAWTTCSSSPGTPASARQRGRWADGPAPFTTSSAAPSAPAAAPGQPQPPATGILTPLGEQLCQQARDYLQSAEPSPGHACSQPEHPTNHGVLSAPMTVSGPSSAVGGSK